MLRYPREGHGMRETQHVADFLDRSLAWYDEHLTATSPAAAQGQEPPGS
jgi:dipeptidyl aminopeptidase/acylaminoacyl peptidase